MEAICSSETLVGYQRTTLRYIPEDGKVKSKAILVTGHEGP
jgi:hypothetical protein